MASIRLTPSSTAVGRLVADRRRWRLSGGWLTAFGATAVALVVLAALLAPWLSRYGPYAIVLDGALLAPSQNNWLGTDDVGRDVFTRVVYGGQVSLLVALVSVAAGLGVGAALGIASGYLGGRTDTVLMRCLDGLMAFPPVLLAITITAALGTGVTNAMIAIAIVSVPGFARLARTRAVELRRREFIDAAQLSGVGDLRIILRHVLPNSAGALVVFATTSMAQAILTQASLAFLGLGAPQPTPDWGSMLQTGYPYLSLAPWLSLVPAAAIAIASLGFMILGDALRDLLDPRLRTIA